MSERYNAYLKSPEWREKREQVLLRDQYKCQDCGAHERLEVHHTTYKRVFHEDLDDLITLCRDCHQNEHTPISRVIYLKAPKLTVKHNPPGTGKRRKKPRKPDMPKQASLPQNLDKISVAQILKRYA